MKKLLLVGLLLVSVGMSDDVIKYKTGTIKLASQTPILDVYAVDKDTSKVIQALPSFSYMVTTPKMDTILEKLKERDKFEVLLNKQGSSDIKPWYLQDSFLYTIAFISGYLIGNNSK